MVDIESGVKWFLLVIFCVFLLTSIAFLSVAHEIRSNMDSFVDSSVNYSIEHEAANPMEAMDILEFCELQYTASIINLTDDISVGIVDEWVYDGFFVREFETNDKYLSGYTLCRAIFLKDDVRVINKRITLIHERCHLISDFDSLAEEEEFCYLYSTDLSNFWLSFYYDLRGCIK